jgi:hypothetical protein
MWMEEDKIQCCDEQQNHLGLFNLTVKISGTPMRDLIKPSHYKPPYFTSNILFYCGFLVLIFNKKIRICNLNIK